MCVINWKPEEAKIHGNFQKILLNSFTDFMVVFFSDMLGCIYLPPINPNLFNYKSMLSVPVQHLLDFGGINEMKSENWRAKSEKE